MDIKGRNWKDENVSRREDSKFKSLAIRKMLCPGHPSPKFGPSHVIVTHSLLLFEIYLLFLDFFKGFYSIFEINLCCCMHPQMVLLKCWVCIYYNVFTCLWNDAHLLYFLKLWKMLVWAFIFCIFVWIDAFIYLR